MAELKTLKAQIVQRMDTAENWKKVEDTLQLLAGEMAVCLDGKWFTIGNGTDNLAALPKYPLNTEKISEVKSTLEQSIAANTAKLDGLTEATVKAEITKDIKAAKEALEVLINANKDKLADVSTTVGAAIKAAVDPVSAKTDANVAKLADVDTTVGTTIEAALTDVKAGVADAKAKLNGLTQDTVKAEIAQDIAAAVKPINDKFAGLEQNTIKKEITEAVKPVSAKTDANAAKLAGLEGTVKAEITKDVEAAKTDLTQAIQDNTDKLAGITEATVKAEITKDVEAAKTELTQTINSKTADLAGLKAKVEGNEAKLAGVGETVKGDIDAAKAAAVQAAKDAILSDGKVKFELLPNEKISNTFVLDAGEKPYTSEKITAAQPGDIAVVNEPSGAQVFILAAADKSQEENWKRMAAPSSVESAIEAALAKYKVIGIGANGASYSAE